jgi:hypothetical protein
MARCEDSLEGECFDAAVAKGFGACAPKVLYLEDVPKDAVGQEEEVSGL